MYEYEIFNAATNKTIVIFGYNYKDARRRWKIDPKDYEVINVKYVEDKKKSDP